MARNQQLVRTAQEKGTKVLAWTSLGFAVVAGPAIAGTFVGDWIDFVLDAVPWDWVSIVILIVLCVATAIDLFMDLIPNHPALISTMLAPTVARSTFGKFGDTIEDWTGSAMDFVDEHLVEWIGTESSTGIALACVATSLILARRTVPKSPGGSAGGGRGGGF